MIKRLIAYYRPYLSILFLDLICAVVISLIDLSFPLILNFCTRHYFLMPAKQIRQGLFLLGSGLILMYILRALCRYYVGAQGHIMGAMMERDMRADLFDQYERLSFSYYDQHNTGVMMSRVVSDLFDISEFAHHGPENIFISVIKIIGSFVILMTISPSLAGILMIVTVLMALFTFLQNRRMERTFMENRRRIGDVNASLQDSLGGMKVIQSFTNEEEERAKFARFNEAFLASRKSTYRQMGLFQSGTSFFQGLLYITIIMAGGYFIVQKKLDPLALAMFALYINIYVEPIMVLVEFAELYQKGFTGFKRFDEVVQEIPEIKDAPDAIELKDCQGAITFEHVSFAYDQAAVIKDINITIHSGESLALVGPSGAGKTTLCALIPRFYEVSEGRILIDGVDIQKLTLRSLRQHIGLVSQDVYLFMGSIRDNIAYGRPDVSLSEIIEAAKKAHIHDFIMSLPEGYETVVGERGTRLSGGQKQRISIARVFLKNPSILLLDEATSALDNESEREIQKSLEELSANRTCLTIAHRLSTIKHADDIIVMDEQGIKERGTHQELLKQDGLYAYYYKLQFDFQS